MILITNTGINKYYTPNIVLYILAIHFQWQRIRMEFWLGVATQLPDSSMRHENL